MCENHSAGAAPSHRVLRLLSGSLSEQRCCFRLSNLGVQVLHTGTRPTSFTFLPAHLSVSPKDNTASYYTKGVKGLFKTVHKLWRDSNQQPLNTCVEAEAQRAVRCSTEPRAALGCVRFAVRFVSLVWKSSCQLQLQTCTLMLNNVLSKNIKCEKCELFVATVSTAYT